jgi:hypothetical protein
MGFALFQLPHSKFLYSPSYSLSILKSQNFFHFSNPQSEVFFSDFRIPTSEFFYVPHALFAYNPQLATLNSQLATCIP